MTHYIYIEVKVFLNWNAYIQINSYSSHSWTWTALKVLPMGVCDLLWNAVTSFSFFHKACSFLPQFTWNAINSPFNCKTHKNTDEAFFDIIIGIIQNIKLKVKLFYCSVGMKCWQVFNSLDVILFSRSSLHTKQDVKSLVF